MLNDKLAFMILSSGNFTFGIIFNENNLISDVNCSMGNFSFYRRSSSLENVIAYNDKVVADGFTSNVIKWSI
jgi:hypothetical protein